MAVRSRGADDELVEHAFLLVDRPHDEPVGEHRDLDEVAHAIRRGRERTGTGEPRLRRAARDDVRDTVDRLAALVVVVVGREHELARR